MKKTHCKSINRNHIPKNINQMLLELEKPENMKIMTPQEQDHAEACRQFIKGSGKGLMINDKRRLLSIADDVFSAIR